MARTLKKKAPVRTPSMAAIVTPEFQSAAKNYARKNGLTISGLVVVAVAEKIGGRIKDGVARRPRSVR